MENPKENTSNEVYGKIETTAEPKWIFAIKIVVAVVFPNIGGMLGAIFSTSDIDEWYPTLNKPSWTPPTWLFAPMWVVLYCLIGLASYLVWRQGNGLKGQAKYCILIYLINLGLNWSWTPVFFNGKNILGGFIVIILVLGTAIIEAATFGYTYWIAGVLIIPYLTWLTIATALNGWIYVNN